jgi:hypothetical protein
MTLTHEEVQRGIKLHRDLRRHDCPNICQYYGCAPREALDSWGLKHGLEILSELQRLRRVEEAADEVVDLSNRVMNYDIGSVEDVSIMELMLRLRTALAAYRAAKEPAQ